MFSSGCNNFSGTVFHRLVRDCKEVAQKEFDGMNKKFKSELNEVKDIYVWTSLGTKIMDNKYNRSKYC